MKPKIKTALLGIVAVVSIVLVCVFIGQGVKNRAIVFEESIKNASSLIQVQEKRRFDLIPNLVETVKGYDKHEYETLSKIISERGVNNKTTGDIRTIINAVAEAYPDLKAQKNYQDLMNELALTENKIAAIRGSYNSEVTRYKRYIRKFPSKQILDLLGYEELAAERLEFENTSSDAPKVDFNAGI